MNVQENLDEIKKQIEEACKKVSRDPSEITIIGVTKYVSIERAKEAVEAGVTDLGENRLEGFIEKYESITSSATWHFIGSLQSRKVKDIIPYTDYIHSLDRKSLAKEINKRAEHPIACFVQVNVSGEESKHGLNPESVPTFIESLSSYPNIKVVGLMTMAPFVEDEKVLRGTFHKLRELRDQIRDKHWEHAPCEFLSMGMSNDFAIAIEEGATHVRIGSKLVGSK